MDYRIFVRVRREKLVFETSFAYSMYSAAQRSSFVGLPYLAHVQSISNAVVDKHRKLQVWYHNGYRLEETIALVVMYLMGTVRGDMDRVELCGETDEQTKWLQETVLPLARLLFSVARTNHAAKEAAEVLAGTHASQSKLEELILQRARVFNKAARCRENAKTTPNLRDHYLGCAGNYSEERKQLSAQIAPLRREVAKLQRRAEKTSPNIQGELRKLKRELAGINSYMLPYIQA